MKTLTFDQTEQSKLANGMTIRYLVVVLLLALFAVGTHLLLESLVTIQTTSAAEINVAGRQRMLFNRILLLGRTWTLAQSNTEEARKQKNLLRMELLQQLELMQKSHDSLLHGDPLIGISPPQTAALHALYWDEPEAVDRHVQAFLAMCKRVLAQPGSTVQSDQPASDQTFLELDINSLLSKLNQVVIQYQHDAEARLTKLIHMMSVLLWIQLFLLLVSALFVFRPMVHHLKRYIEEQAQARESLRVAMEAAQTATQAKGEFLANMSHEIRTPMNAIIGLSHLCLQTPLSARQKDYLRKVHSSALSLLRIINDILDFSKIEAGRLDMESIPFTLEEVLGSMTSMIAMKAQEKNLAFLIKSAVDIPPNLLGDPLRLGQILINLTNNAIKFTESGEVVVETTLLEQGENFVRLQFIVRDTGIGMTPTQLDRLFRAFSQADTSITRKFGGTGLGLTIAKRLIEMMGGTIRVESIPNQSTRFIFDVRLGLSNQGVTKENTAKVPTQDFMRVLSGAKILLVEDNEINQQVARELLEMANITVVLAQNGKEAVDWVFKEPWDGVLMDLHMSVMDGMTATRQIRNDARFARLPILAMTANAMSSDRKLCLEAGMQDHIAKPVDPDQLYATLACWIKPANPKPLPDLLKQEIPVNIETLPDIPGLDIPEGVLRMGSNVQGYRDLLIKFSTNYRESIAAIRVALEAADTPTAERLVHTLKGVAGTIGADLLEEHAKIVERAIQAGEKLEAMEERLQEAEEELATLCTDIESALPSTASRLTEGAEEENRSAQLFRQLARELATCDAESSQTLTTLYSTTLSEPMLAWIIQLEKEVSRYEFAQAAEILKQCADALGIDLDVEHAE